MWFKRGVDYLSDVTVFGVIIVVCVLSLWIGWLVKCFVEWIWRIL